MSSHTTSLSGRMLSHSPMSLTGLTCSLELSNWAVLVTTAMQCGMPIPPSCVRFPLSAASVAHDSFGHFTSNSNRNTARYSSHELIVRELTAELSFAGLQVSCDPLRIQSSSHYHSVVAYSDLVSDIAIFNSDISTDKYYPQRSPSP